ncbi:hypothetical protein PSACC_02594 [Paramicrosporidium saccamoebae]|uniref:Uncharacterized protein n=1 Tax=Paramicrosporidium saccamoebae TaxID=1246581 RepID=A0A2H9TIL9_9FUNG|nr:hypothetical protein PSACC_02594 [Paramicrosporidium saccamoebae]
MTIAESSDNHVPKPYQIPHFSGPKTTEEYMEEAKNCDNPNTLYMDKKSERSRELLIFMGETNIWEDILQDCVNRAGVNASGACAKLHEIVDERNNCEVGWLEFKSAKDYDAYKFDGAGIPVWELKREIVQAKKLGKSTDFDLILTNAQSSEDYTDDMKIIPKNAQVVVKRVPAAAGKRMPAFQPRAPSTFSTITRPFMATPSTAGATGDEDSKIAAMMAATGSHWEQNQQDMPMQQQGPRRFFRPPNFRGQAAQAPPDTYVCYRCGQKGHYIQYCPTNADPTFDRTRVRKTTGIPKSFLKPVSSEAADPSSSAAVLVTPEGNLVVAAPNEREWDRISTIKSLADTAASIPPEAVPQELKCALGDHLLNNAVRVPCCTAAFCDDCMRKLFEESSTSAGAATTGIVSIECPSCKKQIIQDKVLPHEELRAKVILFLESHNKFALPKENNEEGISAQKSPMMNEPPKPSPPLPPHMFPPGMPPLPFFLPGFLPPGLPPMFPHPHHPVKRGAHDDRRGRDRSQSPSRSRSRSPKRGRQRSRSPRRRSYSRSRSP